MPCQRKTSKTYTKNRRSPPYAASSCKGKIKKGNDGFFYVSKKSQTTGKYRWVKKTVLTRKSKTLPHCESGYRRNSKTRRCRMTEKTRSMARSMRSLQQEPSDPIMTAIHVCKDGVCIDVEFTPTTDKPEGDDWILYSPSLQKFMKISEGKKGFLGIGRSEPSVEPIEEEDDLFFMANSSGKVWVTDEFANFNYI